MVRAQAESMEWPGERRERGHPSSGLSYGKGAAAVGGTEDKSWVVAVGESGWNSIWLVDGAAEGQHEEGTDDARARTIASRTHAPTVVRHPGAGVAARHWGLDTVPSYRCETPCPCWPRRWCRRARGGGTAPAGRRLASETVGRRARAEMRRGEVMGGDVMAAAAAAESSPWADAGEGGFLLAMPPRSVVIARPGRRRTRWHQPASH